MEDKNLVKTVFIPEWVYRKLIRNYFNILDILNIPELTKVLNGNDLYSIDFLTYYLKFNSDYTGINRSSENKLGIKYFPKEQITDSNWYSLPWANETCFHEGAGITEHVAEIESEITDRLSHRFDKENDKVPYKFIIGNNLIIVVLDEGFLDVLTTKNNNLKFIREYLKSLYKLMPISVVSSTNIFNSYVDIISKQQD